MIKNHSHAIEILSNCLPYFNQAKDFDMSQDTCIYMTWRGERFKIEYSSVNVMISDGMILEGSNSAMLMSRIIKMALNPTIYKSY